MKHRIVYKSIEKQGCCRLAQTKRICEPAHTPALAHKYPFSQLHLARLAEPKTENKKKQKNRTKNQIRALISLLRV